MAEVRDQISAVLYNAVSAALDVPPDGLSDSTELVKDLGAKSVNFVRIISVLEDELDLDVSFQELRRRKRIGDIIEYLVELYDEE